MLALLWPLPCSVDPQLTAPAGLGAVHRQHQVGAVWLDLTLRETWSTSQVGPVAWCQHCSLRCYAAHSALTLPDASAPSGTGPRAIRHAVPYPQQWLFTVAGAASLWAVAGTVREVDPLERLSALTQTAQTKPSMDPHRPPH